MAAEKIEEDVAIGEEQHKLSKILERLSAFSKNNPNSLIQSSDGDVSIVRPWGDDSLALRLGSNAASLFDALNSVHLPPTLSAIFHVDTKHRTYAVAGRRYHGWAR